MAIPKIFFSYSHDDLKHKKWVLDLATRARNNGINSILDQWELTPGDDLPHFMETNLASSDYILMICTDRYVQKANAGKGGVGYEKMIITSNLLNSIDENKIIPIIRQKGTFNVPTFLKTKLFINFSKDDEFEFSYDELVRTIHNSPLFEKPEIGNNPFKIESELKEKEAKSGIIEIIKVLVYFFETSPTNRKYIHYDLLRENTSTSRIYLDILISEALELGYITKSLTGNIYLSDKGKLYAYENNLIGK